MASGVFRRADLDSIDFETVVAGYRRGICDSCNGSGVFERKNTWDSRCMPCFGTGWHWYKVEGA